MRQIRLIVEYDGTTLHGWQRQRGQATVQQHLEEALAQILQQETPVTGASRTDAGVHARGQVACFRTDRSIPLHGIRRGMNSLLPPSVAVVDAAEVPEDFHPRFSATGKHYRYSIWTRAERSPLLRDRTWHHPEAIAEGAIREAVPHLIGEHDFAAFRAAGCTAKTTVRRVDAIDVERAGDLLTLDVWGNAFLRNMVRILAGTLAEVGAGRRAPAQVAEILASKDRTRAGFTAPAQGLELVSVHYDGVRAAPV